MTGRGRVARAAIAVASLSILALLAVGAWVFEELSRSPSQRALDAATEQVHADADRLADIFATSTSIFPADGTAARIERDLVYHYAIQLSHPVSVQDGKAGISVVLFARGQTGGGWRYGSPTVRMCVHYEVTLGSSTVEIEGESCPPGAPEASTREGQADTTVDYEP